MLVMKKKVKIKREKLNFEIPAYVLGIIAIVQAFFSPIIAVVLSIIGLVFSYRQKTEFSRRARILNYVGLGISLLIIILGIIFYIKLGGSNLFLNGLY